MNRRGFIAKTAVALCGALIPVVLGGQHVPRSFPYSFDGGNIPYTPEPQPRRIVLVMNNWWTTERWVGLDLSSRSSPDVSFYDIAAPLEYGWKKPRIALSWKEIRFEELKKGNHYRLIDEPVSQYEDGKLVHVAEDDARRYGQGEYEWSVLSDDTHSYPGKGAGFDWYEIVLSGGEALIKGHV